MAILLAMKALNKITYFRYEYEIFILNKNITLENA